ncbi:MAG TPA: DUF177 domain-containing protein [Clostridiaceae bacterium]|nr:DUF177 domain-containing protein [Clostridiaceae bacterium]
MKLDVSTITKLSGRSMDVEFNGKIEALNDIVKDGKFDTVFLKGKLVNIDGVLELNGQISTKYRTGCYRCLKEVTKELSIKVSENFVREGSQTESDEYTYNENYVELEQMLIDNIVLHLPTRVLCSENCKGLCQKCGCDLNIKSCQCKEDNIDPRMETLKKFFES